MAQAAAQPKRSNRNKVLIRHFVQAFFFILIALIAVNHTLAESGKGIPFLSAASLHALCPFGGVVTAYQFAAAGTFVKKVHDSSFILMILGMLLAVAFGPVFCGWVCPLGTFQEWLAKIGRKIFKRKYNHFIPAKVDRVLRYFRYIILIGVVYMTAKMAVLVFERFDPYFTLFNFWTSEVAIPGLIVLGATILLSLFVERPWCKYACPYGALIGIFNLFRVFKIKRNEPACISCKACNRACPMNIQVMEKTTVRDHQCISCLECTSEYHCPVAKTVEFRIGGFGK